MTCMLSCRRSGTHTIGPGFPSAALRQAGVTYDRSDITRWNGGGGRVAIDLATLGRLIGEHLPLAAAATQGKRTSCAG